MAIDGTGSCCLSGRNFVLYPSWSLSGNERIYLHYGLIRLMSDNVRCIHLDARHVIRWREIDSNCI